jgi:hypothetical protein
MAKKMRKPKKKTKTKTMASPQKAAVKRKKK